MWLPNASWIRIGVLAFLVTGVGLGVYTGVRRALGTKYVQEANRLRQEASAALADRDKFRSLAEQKSEALQKANAKIGKLQASLDKIKIPPPATPPDSLGQTILDLRTMGMELVLKPSLMVSPSIAGITQNDAKLAWSWGNEARRIPYFESKITAYDGLVKGLEKAKGLAESLADLKGKEADSASLAAEKSEQRAEAEMRARLEVEKVLKAERVKKYLYTAGGIVLGAVAEKKLQH